MANVETVSVVFPAAATNRNETVLGAVLVHFPMMLKELGVTGNGVVTIKSNDPVKVESNFFCYAATVLSPHRNVLIFTQRMHKHTGRPFTR